MILFGVCSGLSPCKAQPGAESAGPGLEPPPDPAELPLRWPSALSVEGILAAGCGQRVQAVYVAGKDPLSTNLYPSTMFMETEKGVGLGFWIIVPFL